ncbi:spore coat protein YlbD [Candidatus Stoquefichus sp. SB1]|uniref:spore coat protein YlbD n=1 Tax=Candidatus Stoquefichus sp. SB1 TaxID=1658109 RepID=UPI000ACE7C2A|nr:spore coat protein YlbD [Candidatus Stoquefichus sp. SB1]
MEIDDFKAFVRTIPSIKDEVVKGRYTWQQLYEFYVLYGADDKMWEPYKKSQVDLTGLLDIIKNVDLDALAKSFEGIQKVLDLVSGFVVKDEPKSQAKQWYDD